MVGLYTFLKILSKICISVVLHSSTNDVLMKVSIAERNSVGNPVADLTPRKVFSLHLSFFSFASSFHYLIAVPWFLALVVRAEGRFHFCF